jgi:hypothetical protein
VGESSLKDDEFFIKWGAPFAHHKRFPKIPLRFVKREQNGSGLLLLASDGLTPEEN